MPTYASNQSDVEFEKAPCGMQQAVLAHVFDIGHQESIYQGKKIIAHKCIFVWELMEKFTEGNFAGKPFLISKYYTQSLGEKANLRKDLESWRGQPFTEEELKQFDLEKLIGVNCYLNIGPTESGKRKILAITPLSKGMIKMPIMDATPSEKIMEWINRERAKAVELKTETTPMAEPHDEDGDGLPF